jgi:hypothetical protein
LIRAQALGDLQALRQRNYRVIRIHFGADVIGGLRSTQHAIDQALGAKKIVKKQSGKPKAAKKSIRPSAQKNKSKQSKKKAKKSKR